MGMQVKSPGSIIGSRIDKITSSVIGVHAFTDQAAFRFFIQLSNGVTIELMPDGILHCDIVPINRELATIQTADGPPSVDAEDVIAVVYRKASSVALMADVGDGASRQVALILSSGRAAMNAGRCGGGNVLHVESIEILAERPSNEWRDFWTGERIDLEKIAGAAKK